MSQETRARAGISGMVAGLLGVISALLLLAWPPQVAANHVSCPFTTTGFRVAQTGSSSIPSACSLPLSP